MVGKQRSGVQIGGALPSLSRCDCLHVLTTGPPRPTAADLMFRNDGVGGSNPSCGTTLILQANCPFSRGQKSPRNGAGSAPGQHGRSDLGYEKPLRRSTRPFKMRHRIAVRPSVISHDRRDGHRSPPSKQPHGARRQTRPCPRPAGPLPKHRPHPDRLSTGFLRAWRGRPPGDRPIRFAAWTGAGC
jgi:hypothetical protein